MGRLIVGIGVFNILVFSCVFGDCAQAPEASMRWAERLLVHSAFEYQDFCSYGKQAELRDAEQAFSDILKKYDCCNGRAWAGLARAQAGLGEYSKSVYSYQKALSCIPGHKGLKGELSKVKDQETVAQTVSAFIPKGETVLQVLPYNISSERHLWAVLSANIAWNKDYCWPDMSNSHLAIFKGTPKELVQVWRSGVLGYPGYTDGEFNDVYLYVKDVTGDCVPDLVLFERLFGASWMPSHIDIFTLRSGKIAHLLGAVTDDAIFVKDLNGDGRYEVITDHAVGWGISHAGQPRWLNIYAYKNATYVSAEKDFPSQYRKLYREILAAFKDSPNDFELLYYLGRIYEIQRRPHAALLAYKRAEKSAEKEMAEWRKQHEADLIQRISNTQRNICARISYLKHFTPSTLH